MLIFCEYKNGLPQDGTNTIRSSPFRTVEKTSAGKLFHECDVAGSAGGHSLLTQDRQNCLRQLAQHGKAALVVYAGIFQRGGVQRAVGLEVLALEVDGGDLVAVPGADLVPQAALCVSEASSGLT